MGLLRKYFGQNSPRKTDFMKSLKRRFRDNETVDTVIDTLEKLQLPIPEKSEEYIWAKDGLIIFSSQRGVVIRIEKQKATKGERIDDSLWFLRPIQSRRAGKAIIEICPGVNFEKDQHHHADFLRETLAEEGFECKDVEPRNIGTFPISTPAFPDGVPVIIDRFTAFRLSDEVTPIAASLHKAGLSEDPYAVLYADLIQQFEEAWPAEDDSPDPEKMKACWAACEEHVQTGQLIAGWKGYETGDNRAINAVENVAKSAIQYDQRSKHPTPPSK